MVPLCSDKRGPLSPHMPQLDTKFPISPLSLAPSDCGTSKDDQNESQLQDSWDEHIANKLDLPDGYRDVQVLMIKWEDDIDELQTREEVEELARVFNDRFRYGVTTIELGPANPPVQLQKEIYSWILDHDSKENLLIVYYAGHGVYDESTKDLILTPTATRTNSPTVPWSKADKIFFHEVRADVFAIMDCCYASDLMRNVVEDGRTFVMLAASGIGLTTPSPGKFSFTRSLIEHLRTLLENCDDGGFTTWDLLEAMQKERGGDYAPAFWRRLPTTRHIHIRALKPFQDHLRKKSLFPSHAAFLRLGFALKNEGFSTQHIEALTKKLPGLFREEGAPVVDIRFLGYHKTGRSKFRDIAYFVKENRGKVAALTASHERKRSADEAGLDC